MGYTYFYRKRIKWEKGGNGYVNITETGEIGSLEGQDLIDADYDIDECNGLTQ